MKEKCDSANLKRDLGSTFCNNFPLTTILNIALRVEEYERVLTPVLQQYIPLELFGQFLLKKMIKFLEPSRKRNFDGEHSQDESMRSTVVSNENLAVYIDALLNFHQSLQCSKIHQPADRLDR